MTSKLPKIFFITGCQRSGVTLLRLILESHSQVSCIDEYNAYNILEDANLLKKELANNKNKEWLGFKVPRLAEQMLEPYLVDVGIDFRIVNVYVGKPIIFMIRNVFDTIASMKTLEQYGKSWIEVWAKKSIDFWITINDDFRYNYREDLDLLKNSDQKLAVAGAIYWKFKTSSFFDYHNEHVPITTIRYEDLVTNSKKTIHDIIKFLGINWEDSLLSHEKKIHPETDMNGFAIGNTNTKLPIFNSSVNKYEKYLTFDEIREISKVSKELMLKLNYTM